MVNSDCKSSDTLPVRPSDSTIVDLLVDVLLVVWNYYHKNRTILFHSFFQLTVTKCVQMFYLLIALATQVVFTVNWFFSDGNKPRDTV